MADYVEFSCCAAACHSGLNQGFAQPVGMIGSAASLLAEGVEMRPYSPEPPSRSTAVHEAAHAVVGLLEGLRLERVTVEIPACAYFDTSRPRSVGAGVRVSLAGRAAEDRMRRLTATKFDHELDFYTSAIASGNGGACDECQAIGAIMRAFPGLETAEIRRFYRTLEARVLELVRRPDVWRAIGLVADALLERLTLTGDEVHSIVQLHIDLG